MSLLVKIRTMLSLGLPSVLRAISYRMGVRLGLNPVRRLRGTVPMGPFFEKTKRPAREIPCISNEGYTIQLFSHWQVESPDFPPDWMTNYLTGKRMESPDKKWWQIPYFDLNIGDIKVIWELSRMDWVLALAQRAANGDAHELVRLNAWLTDWCVHNPPYQGPNWKCGQEASIRVMHFAIAAILLGQVQKPSQGLRDLLYLHLQRIAPTMQYSIAQDNNHGTSEAAGLFIGGSWLAMLGVPEGVKWEKMGRIWLEKLSVRLIGNHGTFSQYSLNYHRVMLDTFSTVEIWRRYLNLAVFSDSCNNKIINAALWLYHMINVDTGDGPNVGSNDGARLLQLSDATYRDYRPSVQLAVALFMRKRAYQADGIWNVPMQWLDVVVPEQPLPAPTSYIADDGGFAMIRSDIAMVMLRYPRFRFRPIQADALHLDLWCGGINLLRDAGSYSYNTEPQWLNYFNGTASHNTVQFDERDQMPRISRFLLGSWLKTSRLEPFTEDSDSAKFGAGYRDSWGASHFRRINLGTGYLGVEDEIAGFAKKAVLRWRLSPRVWRLESSNDNNFFAISDIATITVQTTMHVSRCEIVDGWESRHYLEKTVVPVLELEVHQPGSVITKMTWMV